MEFLAMKGLQGFFNTECAGDTEKRRRAESKSECGVGKWALAIDTAFLAAVTFE